MTGISVSEWRAELERVLRRTRTGDAGVTVAELHAATGLGKGLLCQLLRAFPPGTVVTGRKPMVDLSGRRTSVPCYRLVTRHAKKAR